MDLLCFGGRCFPFVVSDTVRALEKMWCKKCPEKFGKISKLGKYSSLL